MSMPSMKGMDRDVNVGQAMACIQLKVRLPDSLAPRATTLSSYSGKRRYYVDIYDKWNIYHRSPVTERL